MFILPPPFLGGREIKHQRKNYIKEKDISLPVFISVEKKFNSPCYQVSLPWGSNLTLIMLT